MRRRTVAPPERWHLTREVVSWLAELSAGGSDELRVGVGMTCETPTAVRSFGEQDPGSFGERRVVCRRGHDARELGDHRKLLVAIQRSRVREDLHSNISVVAVDVRQTVWRQ